MRHALVVLVCSLACRTARDTDHTDEPPLGDTGHADSLLPIGVDIGTAHPITLLYSAANGRWQVVCQARHDTDDRPGIDVRFDEDAWIGDALTPYLLRGAGEGVAIDGFVAASRDDRWLVLVRAHQLVLFDEVHGTEQVLARADARGAGSGGGRSVAAFDRRSEQLIYARRSDGEGRVAIRTLATGEEHERSIGGQAMWQVTREPDERWIQLSYIRTGFVSPTRVYWPHLESTSQPGRLCRGEDYNARGRTSANIEYSYLRTDTGELVRERPAKPFAANVYASFADYTVGYAGYGGTGIWITDIRTGKTTPLPALDGFIGESAGRFVAVGNAVVDIAAARVVGDVAQTPLAVDASGRALVPAIDRTNEHLAIGPLHWTTPVARKIP